MMKQIAKIAENIINEETDELVARWYNIKIYDDDQEVGYAELFVSYDEDGDEKSAYINSIEIYEQYRNHGFGTAALKEIAAEHGGIYICPDNEDAERLYARIGEETSAPDELEAEMDNWGVMYYIA